MSKKNEIEQAREDEARKILERVERDTETVGTSSMRRIAERMKSHVSAEDADQNEWADLWGTRIGRTLGIIFFIGLIIYLYRTYILHV